MLDRKGSVSSSIFVEGIEWLDQGCIIYCSPRYGCRLGLEHLYEIAEVIEKIG